MTMLLWKLFLQYKYNKQEQKKKTRLTSVFVTNDIDSLSSSILMK